MKSECVFVCRVESICGAFEAVLASFWWPQRPSGNVGGHGGPGKGTEPNKVSKTWFVGTPFGAISGPFCYMLSNHFLRHVLEATFSSHDRVFGPKDRPRGSKRDGKGTRKGLQINVAQCVKTILFIAQNTHWSFRRQARRPNFPRLSLEMLPGCAPRQTFHDFFDFGRSSGVRSDHLFVNFFGHKIDMFFGFGGRLQIMGPAAP